MIDGTSETERLADLYNPKAAHSDSKIVQLRVPPQSVESEQAVLGGLMLAPEAWDDVADMLTEASFYRRDHQLIWRAIDHLQEKNKPFDAVTLGEWFESQGMSEQVAGGAYLVELASTTPSAANIRAYAEIVSDKATLRKLIEVGTGIVNDGFEPNGRESSELVARAATAVIELGNEDRSAGGLRFIRNHLGGVFDEITKRYEGTADPGLVPPWKNVADIISGLEAGDFMLLAARPSMGKTVGGLEFGYSAAKQGRNVAVFSLEMSSTQLTQRLLSRIAGIPTTRMRMQGGLEDEDWSLLTAAIRELKELPLAIDDSAALTIDSLSARARRMHKKVPGGLGLIVIDYVQLIEGPGRGESRYEEITAISRGLKKLGKSLGCPVIGLSQLNRGLETRNDKRPVMADLRESGALEQDADIIAFLYRDEYYSKDKCGAPGIVEFIIGKQRNGPTGTAYLKHDLACSRFYDYFGPRPNYKFVGAAEKSSEDGFDDDSMPRRRHYKSRPTKVRDPSGSDLLGGT